MSNAEQTPTVVDKVPVRPPDADATEHSADPTVVRPSDGSLVDRIWSVGRPRAAAVLGIVVAVVVLWWKGYGGSGYDRTLLISALAAGMVGLSIVVITGLTGQISFAQLALMALAAYIVGTLSGYSQFASGQGSIGLIRLGAQPAMPFVAGATLSVVLTTLFATAIALPALRIRGLHLALVTLALAYALQVVVFSNGWVNANIEDVVLDRPGIIASDTSAITVGAGLLAVASILTRNVVRSRFGRAMSAVRDSEVAASTIGLNVAQVKTYAFAFAGMLSAAGGVFFMAYFRQISTVQSLDISKALLLFGIVVVCGLRSVGAGVAAGALYVFLPEYITDAFGVEWVPVVAGAAVIAVVLAAPQGLASLTGRVHGVLRGRSEDQEVTA